MSSSKKKKKKKAQKELFCLRCAFNQVWSKAKKLSISNDSRVDVGAFRSGKLIAGDLSNCVMAQLPPPHRQSDEQDKKHRSGPLFSNNNNYKHNFFHSNNLAELDALANTLNVFPRLLPSVLLEIMDGLESPSLYEYFFAAAFKTVIHSSRRFSPSGTFFESSLKNSRRNQNLVSPRAHALSQSNLPQKTEIDLLQRSLAKVKWSSQQPVQSESGHSLQEEDEQA